MPFDDFWYDDFDGDGKISESDKFFSDWMFDDLAHSWRKEVEDGAEYGLDPRDYEFRENYEKALDEARHEWRATAEFSFKLSPEDYETEEEYNAALARRRARGEDEFTAADRIPLRSIYESGAYPPPKAVPVKVRPQNSAKPAKPPAPSPPEQVYRSQGIKPSTAIIICVTLVLCVVLGLYGGIRNYRQRNTFHQEYIDEVKAACEKYGIDDVKASVRVEAGRYVNFYYTEIMVNGLSGLALRDQYKLVKELCDLDVERSGYTGITMPKVYCEGQEYDIDPLDEHTLQVDGKDVYPVPTQKPSSTWGSKSYTSSSSSKNTTTTTKAATATKSTTSSASKKTTTTRYDPYDVQDYSDPEEFYYYHYDDFYDYEDAEDYFNEYGG